MDEITIGGVTFVAKDIGGGKWAIAQVPVDISGAEAMGLVAANPAANTLLGRLKAIVDALTGKATEAKQDAGIAAIEGLKAPHYKKIAAGTANGTLGAAPAAGNILASLTIIPATKSPGAVSIKDGAGAAITVFAGGADSVSTLHPFTIPIGAAATGAGWAIVTGADVSVIATGRFT